MHIEKYKNNEKMKKASSSGILETRYHNGSCLLLLGRENYRVLEFHVNNCA